MRHIMLIPLNKKDISILKGSCLRFERIYSYIKMIFENVFTNYLGIPIHLSFNNLKIESELFQPCNFAVQYHKRAW